MGDIRNHDDSKWTLNKSTIKFPCASDTYSSDAYSSDGNAVRTGGVDSKDEILVIGFVNDCFKQKEFDNLQLPPAYIIEIIAEWYSAEMIHWIELDGDHHRGIYLKEILASC